MRGKAIVLLDTNFLVDIVRFKIGLKDELARVLGVSCVAFIVPSVSNELEKLAVEGNIHARLALGLLQKIGIGEFQTGYKLYTDETIFNICKDDKNIVVATNDRKLRERLKGVGTKTIYIRAKKHLAID